MVLRPQKQRNDTTEMPLHLQPKPRPWDRDTCWPERPPGQRLPRSLHDRYPDLYPDDAALAWFTLGARLEREAIVERVRLEELLALQGLSSQIEAQESVPAPLQASPSVKPRKPPTSTKTPMKRLAYPGGKNKYGHLHEK